MSELCRYHGSIYSTSLADLGAQGTLPLAQNFFIFMQFFRENWQNNKLAPPWVCALPGNPGSGTAHITASRFVGHDHKNFSCLVACRFPRLAGYVDRMLEVPAVKATYTDPKTQKKFIEGMRDKNPKYDDL